MFEGPKQVNMYGIRYFINGNLSDSYVKKLMVQARNDLQGMKDRNINDIDHIWLNKPKHYKIVSQFGIDSIYIDVPSFREEKQRGFKEIPSETEKESYRFVPAIVLGTPDIIGTGVSWHYVAWQEVGDINVCATANWEGTFDIVKDSPTADVPGEIYKDGIIDPDNIEIRACRNWGNRDFWWSLGEDDSKRVEDLNDPGFSPAPYYGYSGEDGAYDHLMEVTTNMKSPVTEAGIAPIDGCATQYYALKDACLNDEEFECELWRWSDGYCLEYKYEDDPRCCIDKWESSGILARMRCGNGHLYFEYQGDAYQERHYETGVVRIMGICMGYTWPCTEFVHTVIAPRTVAGSPQDRLVNYYKWYHYYVYSNDDIERTNGQIIFDWDGFYGDLDDWTYHLTKPEPCYAYQSDTIISTEVYPLGYNKYGAFIQDTGNEDYVCPIESFHNLYFFVMPEDWYMYARTSDVNGWYINGFYGYDAGGVYYHGEPYNTQKNWDVSQDETFYTLAVCLNGERIEIDRTDDEGDEFTERTDYFYITDSLILDFMGTPVYMYAYVRARHVATSPYNYETIYTRYGYFLNGVHYQSQKFYTEGITIGDDIYNLHDVYGSIARDGKYGFGQCAGYIIKEISKKKGPTEYVQEI